MGLVESSVFPGPLFSSCKKTLCGQRLRKQILYIQCLICLGFHSTPSFVLSQHSHVIKKKINLFLCLYNPEAF